MSNRTEARSAKAARMHATGRLPLLRLFSTPLTTGVEPPEVFARTARDVNVMCGPQSDPLLLHKTKPVLLGKPLEIIHLARLLALVHRSQNPPTFGSWGFDSPSRHHDSKEVVPASCKMQM
jgi:hypothetical protein